MTSTERIEGKVVAITGASSGIGAATARLLAGRGARVIAYAIEQPDDVDVSEIIVRPTASPN